MRRQTRLQRVRVPSRDLSGRLKVLFLIRSLRCGGAERQLATLALQMARRHHEVRVVTFYPDGAYEAELTEAGVSILCLRKKSRWDLLPFVRQLIGTIRRVQPDVVHSYMPGANILAAIAKPFSGGIPLVWGIRASDVDASMYDDWIVWASLRCEALLSHCVDRIIANSHAGKRVAVASGFPAARICVIPNGIDTTRFAIDPDARRRFRARYTSNAQEKLVGLVGRLDPMKNHDLFIGAAALLKSRRPDVRFICVGAGSRSYAEGLMLRASQAGLGDSIVWTGQLDDMRAVYNGLDILCLASLTGEGFPNVVAEAMACGTPCVVNDVGDAAEVVGSLGIVLRPISQETLADAIEVSLSGIHDSGALRARITENFPIERLCDETLRVLTDLRNAQRGADAFF